MRTITRYLLREFLLYFALAMGATSSILILRKIFLLTKEFVRKDVGSGYLAELILYALPSVLALTIPMAVLAGMLMVLGQFSFTGEITAMRASGIGIHQFTMPIVAVGIAFMALDYWMMDVALPWGNTEYLNLRTKIGRSNPALILEEGTVMRSLESDELLWFFEEVDQDSGRLRNLRIWESYRDGHPRLVAAPTGTFVLEGGRAALTLFDGVSYERDQRRPRTVTISRFSRETLYLPIRDGLGGSGLTVKSYRGMSRRELNDEVRSIDRRLATENSAIARQNLEVRRRRASLEAHKKFSIPFACLAFAVVSVPMGVLTRRSGFMLGMVIGLPLIIVYYTLLRIGETLAVDGSVSVAVGSWVANAPTVLLGLVMTVRMRYR